MEQYAGEVWTDARGHATVTLPDPATVAVTKLRYELLVTDARIGVRVVSELVDGRFTIETDEPNVRVTWRAFGRGRVPASRSASASRCDDEGGDTR